MKAVVIHAYGGPDVLKFEDVPDPVPGNGEVLVKIVATSVNPIDYKIRSGAVKGFVTLPAVLGQDVSGIVAALGVGVTKFKVGEKAFAAVSRTYASFCVVKETAVFTAKEKGATEYAGVRASQKTEAEQIGAHFVVALDNEEAVSNLKPLDAVADAVNGKTAQVLIGKVKPGGVWLLFSVSPPTPQPTRRSQPRPCRFIRM
jgi:NADPH:quinone reductase-like Zn-dependent oxidoreductase